MDRNFVVAVKPRFTDRKMKTFMVVQAGNTVRVNIRFEVLHFTDGELLLLPDHYSVKHT